MTKTTKPLTELRDADIRRVDAVKGAANGTRFILAKSAAGQPEGLVSPDAVRDLIAEPPPAHDQYLGVAGELLKAELSTDERKDLSDSEFGFVDEQGVGHYPINDAAHVRNALSRAAAEIKAGGDAAAMARKALPRIEAAARKMGIGEPAEVNKERNVTESTATEEAAPPLSIEEARAVLKQAKADERTAKAALAKADAEPDSKPDDKSDDDSKGDDDTDSSDVEKATAPETPAAPASSPVSLKKAKAIAKAAKLARRAAEDQVAIAKAQAILAKIGRRNSAGDQAHVDAIDSHAAALGATAHLTPTPGEPGVSTPTLVTKGEAGDETISDDQVTAVADVILKAVGPLFEKDRAEITSQLTQVSEQLEKVGRIALPGGPRAVVDRDGSFLAPGDGEIGMTFEQAALAKIAQTYPVGSVEREAIEKAGAKSAIKDLMLARR